MKPVTLPDLRAAVAARLCGIDDSRRMQAAQAIFSLVSIGEGIPLDESSTAAILEGMGIVPEGNIETLSHALIATAAREAEAWHLYYPAAFAVWTAHQQAERARGPRGGDALDGLLRKLITELPNFTTAMLWAEVVRRAEGAGCAILCDYDPARDVLTFEHRGVLTDISFLAFSRRVQRIKKISRHEPGNVASVPDDATHQPDLRKAA